MKGHYVRPPKGLTELERFMRHVAPQANGCMNWTGSVKNPEDPLGSYGQFKFRGKMERAHRVIWILTYGEIPEGKCVLHKCIANRLCVNLEHLYLGTKKQNAEDRKNQGRGGNLKGEANGRARVTEEIVKEIRLLRGPRMGKTSPWTYEKLQERFGIPRSTLTWIVNRKSWDHIPLDSSAEQQ